MYICISLKEKQMADGDKKVEGQAVNALVPFETHKQLKVLAAAGGTTVRALIYTILENKTEELWEGYKKTL
jgi:hypothetical protein